MLFAAERGLRSETIVTKLPVIIMAWYFSFVFRLQFQIKQRNHKTDTIKGWHECILVICGKEQRIRFLYLHTRGYLYLGYLHVGHPIKGMSSRWIALLWVTDKHPIDRPWKLDKIYQIEK